MLAIIGAGYVGLSLSVALAHKGYKNYLCEINTEYIEKLNNGIIPIYEESMQELYQNYFHRKDIIIIDQINNLPNNITHIFLTVGTPSKEDGSINIAYITKAIHAVVQHFLYDIVIIIRSTVPPQYSDNIEYEIWEKYQRKNVYIVFSPEFLREGSALEDTLYPQRLVLGYSSTIPNQLLSIIKKIYLKFVDIDRLLLTDRLSAEISKYTSNIFLAMKVGFINEVARIADYYKASIDDIKDIMSKDDRIGSKHLNPSLGYGGSCFPKDVNGFKKIIEKTTLVLPLITSIPNSNEQQMSYFFEKMKNIYNKNDKLEIGMLGTSFKGGSDDIRDSKPIELIEILLKYYPFLNIHLYDVQAIVKTKNYFNQNYVEWKNRIIYYDTIEKMIQKSLDSLIIASNWDDFKNIFTKNSISNFSMKIIFDVHKVISDEIVEIFNKNGVQYYRI